MQKIESTGFENLCLPKRVRAQEFSITANFRTRRVLQIQREKIQAGLYV
jgi:hypothetical protein